MIELRDPNERRIGPYTIVATIARGATSEILKAIDRDLDRVVAIKLLSKEFVRDPEALARFERESRAVTRLNHPNIARIYEAGISVEGQPYFIMEFIDGRSLMDLIRDKADLPFSRQVDLIIQAAEGLRSALSSNIIHRDIKPANLMVTVEYQVKIVDFGLVKVIGDETYKTVAGRLIGTPRYMAPEIALGRSGDYRSDIYSLGATFYHLLTGQPPFDGETPAAVMMQHLNSPLTPPYLINPLVPADICEIVQKCLAKDPNDRYQDYDELLADLKAAKVARLAKEREATKEGPEALGPEPSLTAPVPSDAAAGRAVPKPAAATTIAPVMKAEPARPAVGGRLFLLILALLLAAGGGLAWFMTAQTSEQRLGLPDLVRSLIGILGRGESPEERYNRQYTDTLKRMNFIRDAIVEYVLAAGEYPGSLDDLVKRKIVTRSELLDGFGGKMRYEASVRRIRAPGPDGVLDSTDDFLMDADGRLLMHPTEPELKQEEEFIKIRERDKSGPPGVL